MGDTMQETARDTLAGNLAQSVGLAGVMLLQFDRGRVGQRTDAAAA